MISDKQSKRSIVYISSRNKGLKLSNYAENFTKLAKEKFLSIDARIGLMMETMKEGKTV